MAQVEKRGGLLRKSSASKKPLKEKVVLMYDEIFMTEDPSKCSPRFWEELFLMKVNLEYLEGKLESLDGEELMKIKDNINCLFQHCIQALGEEHPIRVVNALQTLCALIRGVHQKNKSTSGFDIINMLMGFDKAELCMKNLMESLDSLLCAEGSESLKSLCLKLLLCLVTVTDNISQNTILEYVMINSIFEAILQILSHPPSRREHGYDAVVLLALLVNYRKYESVNPYIVKLSIVDDEATLNGMGLVIAQALSEYNRQYKDKEEEHQSGFFSALTNMVGSMFIADAHEKISVQTNEAILLALYEAVHLNRNFITVLAQSHPEMGLVTTPVSPAPATPATPLGTTPPSSDVISSVELPLDADVQTSNLLITFLKYSSIVMQDTKDEHRLHSGKLCLIILTCIAEDQYANAFLHDDNMNFRVNLHRMPMRHRKKAADKNLPCRPLVCAVLDFKFFPPFLGPHRCVSQSGGLKFKVQTYETSSEPDGRVYCNTHDEGVSYGSLCVRKTNLYVKKYQGAFYGLDLYIFPEGGKNHENLLFYITYQMSFLLVLDGIAEPQYHRDQICFATNFISSLNKFIILLVKYEEIRSVKRLNTKARIWIRNETISHLCMNAKERKKERKVLPGAVRDGKTQPINFHFWLNSLILAATAAAAAGFGREEK
ncbi:hypothetical protein HPG69_019700 [Diceros bicornis minor]|uniref:Uncharacterized protein n=1 Tax=Diceros bicornis minor TaxID=77932 RepID=A0A7J7E696_DICBM|nr:hypothetical protein HPG69_019700 [Diceros bicornis minor]